jgi:hypothetical protein
MSAELGDCTTCELDLARAYPAEAGIRSWRRRVILDQAVELVDSWDLEDTPRELVWHLILHGRTSQEDGTIRVDGLTITYDAGAVNAVLEPLPLTDPRLSVVWGSQVTRAVLTARPALLARAGEARVTFRPPT